MFFVEVPGASEPVDVESLQLSETYAELIEGRPTLELNRRFLARRLQEAEAYLPHMPLKHFAPKPVEGRWMPRICCLAVLNDGQRSMKLLWFQQRPEGLPYPPVAVLAKLRWSRDAREYEL